MNLSDWRETLFNRMYFAKMITQETREKISRIPRTILAVGPVSLKKERMFWVSGRLSVRTGWKSVKIIQFDRNIRMGEGQREWTPDTQALCPA
jgi:hypothetical protein